MPTPVISTTRYGHRGSDPENPGGWLIVVAIADVAHYVRSDSPLDREARKRGNSVYFQTAWCQCCRKRYRTVLFAAAARRTRCLAVEIVIDATGAKRRHRFLRGLMRSAARLTYEETQVAFDDGGSLAGDAALAGPAGAIALCGWHASGGARLRSDAGAPSGDW